MRAVLLSRSHRCCDLAYNVLMSITHSQHDRQSMRLPHYDYTQDGAYFVTIVTRNRLRLFGDVLCGKMVLNDIGKLVETVWLEIPSHFEYVTADAFIIMPNHVHGIILLEGDSSKSIVGTRHAVSLPKGETFGKPIAGSLSTIIRSFKSEVSRQVNLTERTHVAKLWQGRFYEHIIRNEREHQAIFDYIQANAQNWLEDSEFTD